MSKPEPHCFTLRIALRTGVSKLDELGFQRRLLGYAAQRLLRLSGGPLHTVVSSSSRTLSAIDQANLIDRLICDPMVERVAFSGLEPAASDPDAGGVELRSLDFCVCALTALYRVGHVDAGKYLQLLGEHSRSAFLKWETQP